MKKPILFLLTAVLALMPILVLGQIGVTIEGTVTDDVGNPLPGANVFIQGTDYGAASGGRSGEYEFTLPAGMALGQEVTLEARFIGFKVMTAQITLSPGIVTQNFSLKPDVLELSSVVITGLGESLIKEKLGVSIAKVKPQILTRSNEANLVQALAGNGCLAVQRPAPCGGESPAPSIGQLQRGHLA